MRANLQQQRFKADSNRRSSTQGGPTNAVVHYQHLNEDGKVEERLLFLVYNQGWDIDSAKQAKYTNKLFEHRSTDSAN